MTNDYRKLTYNLSGIIESLRRFQGNEFAVAFMKIKDRESDTFRQFFKDQTYTALGESKEFNHPYFSGPLINIIDNTPIDELILITPLPSETAVIVTIDMQTLAGSVEEYGVGISSARRHGGFGLHGDPERASELWREMVYKPAREGGSGDSNLYWQTLELRRQYWQGSAPYWDILENGVTQLVSDKGGDPYPESQKPTRFVTSTELALERYINGELQKELGEVIDRVNREIGVAYDIIAEVNRVLTSESYKAKEYIEPQVIAEYEVFQRRYKLYITKTGKLGFSLRPEI